jgi:hypothetical protein
MKPLALLCWVFTFSIMADTWLSYDWVSRGGHEGNPFWSEKLQHPALVITLDFTICAGMAAGTHWIAKEDKPAAYAIVIAGILVQSYWLYMHCKVRR